MPSRTSKGDSHDSVTVNNGWLALNGTLDWQYQKDAAARTVRDLTGVKGVTNNIIVKPRVKTIDVRDKIEAAFKRSAEIDARRVNVGTPARFTTARLTTRVSQDSRAYSLR